MINLIRTMALALLTLATPAFSAIVTTDDLVHRKLVYIAVPEPDQQDTYFLSVEDADTLYSTRFDAVVDIDRDGNTTPERTVVQLLDEPVLVDRITQKNHCLETFRLPAGEDEVLFRNLNRVNLKMSRQASLISHFELIIPVQNLWMQEQPVMNLMRFSKFRNEFYSTSMPSATIIDFAAANADEKNPLFFAHRYLWTPYPKWVFKKIKGGPHIIQHQVRIPTENIDELVIVKERNLRIEYINLIINRDGNKVIHHISTRQDYQTRPEEMLIKSLANLRGNGGMIYEIVIAVGSNTLPEKMQVAFRELVFDDTKIDLLEKAKAAIYSRLGGREKPPVRDFSSVTSIQDDNGAEQGFTLNMNPERLEVGFDSIVNDPVLLVYHPRGCPVVPVAPAFVGELEVFDIIASQPPSLKTSQTRMVDIVFGNPGEKDDFLTALYSAGVNPEHIKSVVLHPKGEAIHEVSRVYAKGDGEPRREWTRVVQLEAMLIAITVMYWLAFSMAIQKVAKRYPAIITEPQILSHKGLYAIFLLIPLLAITNMVLGSAIADILSGVLMHFLIFVTLRRLISGRH